ncbi:MAG: hypothetical protein ACRDQA_06615, partial [Nocardioidaceae bacterium]
MTRFRGIRQALLETPYLPVAAYLGAVGIAALVAGHAILPDTLAEVLPAWLATVWTVAVAAGGILPVVGRVVSATRIESAGLAMLAFGAGLYGVCIAVAAWPYG